jgi:urate oxidase
MPVQLISDRYGKSRVRVLRVTKHEPHHDRGAYHDIDEWNVQVLLSGDFETAHTLGDNSKILPTDTMKNTVYSLAHDSKATSIEDFAIELIDFLLARNPQVATAEVVIESILWKRLTIDGAPYPTAFMRGSNELQTTTVSRSRAADGKSLGTFTIASGFNDLTVMKTANSAFAGYIKDSLTTLPETHDRIFCTAVKADWTYTPAAISTGLAFNKVRHHLREAMVSAFAKHDSLSVQQTLYAMAESALEHTDVIDQVAMRMPNKHCLLIDLSRFNQTNANHIFVPTDEPHGTIEATIRRA